MSCFKVYNLLLGAFLLTSMSACSYKLQSDDPLDRLDNLKFLAESSDINLLSKETTNWIPGSFFPTEYGYEELDYVIFPQSGVVSLNPTYIHCTLIPEQYRSFNGVAPERSFKIIIKPEEHLFSQDDGKLSLCTRESKAEVVFQSGYDCISILNSQEAMLSIIGGNMISDVNNQVIHYVGDLEVLVELPGGYNLTLKYTDLYYYPEF